MEARPGGEGERVDADVAALRDEGDAARLAQRHGVAPQRRPAVHGDDAVAVGADDGEVVAGGCRHHRGLEGGSLLLARSLGEASGVHDDPAGAEPSALVDEVGDAGRGGGDDDGVGRGAEGRDGFGERRHARDAVGLGAAGVDPDEAALEAGEHQVAGGLPAVGRGAVGGADDDDAARGEESGEIHRCECAPDQVSIVVTPRFSSARATMIFWISDEPSQMRSTRSSRQ